MQAEVTEFMILTTGNRLLRMQAENYRDLFSDLHFDGHTAQQVWTLDEYQAEVADREEQHRMYDELARSIEEERKTA